MRIARPGIAEPLEAVAVRLKDLDALSLAHDLVARPLSGPARAEELVRQAEVLATAGVEPLEAVQHGERALTSIAPDDAEPLLARLAQLLPSSKDVVDLYERQIGRCKAPEDRLAALARAAQVAAERDELERARKFFDAALAAGAQESTIESLEKVARSTDEARGGSALRTTLAEALAAGGQGSRDGGRTRGALLRRAAVMAFRELSDTERAFGWLGDSLVTHVDDAGLDALVELADEVKDVARADTVITRALTEVFDGPLVRKLLARRADLRSDRLGDKRAAAEDLKRLHELAPADTDVMEKLSGLYTELEDYRGMVQLYEDQILRGRDQNLRAELARKVARLWEERLDDAREAADAWRRVLRMKAGDAEATVGLERAKSNMLKKPAPDADDAGAAKKSSPSQVKPLPPPPPPAKSAPAHAAPEPEEPEPAQLPEEPSPVVEEPPQREEARASGDEAEPSAEPERARYVEPVTPTAPADVVQAAAAATAETPVPDAMPVDRGATMDSDAPTRVFELDASASAPSEPPAAEEPAAQEPAREEPPKVEASPPPAPEPTPEPPKAAAADLDDDIDVDLSGMDDEPPPVRVPPPKRQRSKPPPPPSKNRGMGRSSTPPPLPGSMSPPKPPPPPSLRNSRPPPPPPRKAAKGDDEDGSEDVVDDDELF
jgi:tetratricopeptide (TPR) repeat protein